MQDFLQHIDHIERYSTSTWILLVALLIIFISLFKRDSKKPQILGFSFRENMNYYSLGIGILFLFSSQLLRVSDNYIERKLSPASVLERVKQNERVRWVIRIIPYSEEERNTHSIDNIINLGKTEHEYIFVADYEELRGYTIREAIYKTGGPAHLPYATIIIFPLEPNITTYNSTIYPANCRGVIQVIQEIDKSHKNDPSYTTIDLFLHNLSEDARKNLLDKTIESWTWDSYNEHFTSFNKALQKYREAAKNPCALRYLGNINSDWHEVGVSTVKENKKLFNYFYLNHFKEGKVEINNLGARVFLFKNLNISKIKGKILMEIEVKDDTRIPDFGGKFNIF